MPISHGVNKQKQTPKKQNYRHEMSVDNWVEKSKRTGRKETMEEMF